MASLLNAQRRFLLLLVTAFFTLLVRLISFSMGTSLREHNGAVTYSDRGQLKQVVLRFTRQRSSSSFAIPLKAGIHLGEPGTPYLLRIANFSPYIRVENLDLLASSSSLPHKPIYGDLFLQSCGDGGGSDGGSDGDGDSGCDGSFS
jgi:hypothetical protein